MAAKDLSLTEWVVLAIVAEAPSHGFAISRELQPGTDLGRIMTVRRPLVYRALSRLLDTKMIREAKTEPGDSGPNRIVMGLTRNGRAALTKWFDAPVDHIRDLRIEFLLKLRLTERSGRNPAPLVAAQRAELAATFETLAAGGNEHDVVDQWRQHAATAANNFLANL